MLSKIVLTVSAVLLFGSGLMLDFMPQETWAALGQEASPVAATVLQVLAAALLGVGYLNFLSRQNPMGGIYARPLALANFLLFGVSALSLDRVAMHGVGQMPFKIAGAGTTVMAIVFGYVLFLHDPIGKRGPGIEQARD